MLLMGKGKVICVIQIENIYSVLSL